MSDDRLVKSALIYADMGFAVFPLIPGRKEPIQEGGFHNATTDAEIIKRWWSEKPSSNIGIATGAKSGGVFVLDIDNHVEQGPDGFDSLRRWEAAEGDLPSTATSITGSGGNQYLYRSDVPIKSRVGVLKGIDVRGEGGYIVAPPSIHPNGRRYTWDIDAHLNDIGITEADDNVIKLATYRMKDGNSFSLPAKAINAGSRNDTIFRLVCSLQSKGLSDRALLAVAHIENEERCKPPLPWKEVEEIVHKVMRYEKGAAEHFGLTRG